MLAPTKICRLLLLYCCCLDGSMPTLSLTAMLLRPLQLTKIPGKVYQSTRRSRDFHCSADGKFEVTGPRDKTSDLGQEGGKGGKGGFGGRGLLGDSPGVA